MDGTGWLPSVAGAPPHVPQPPGTRMIRRVLHLSAYDSPNVQMGFAQASRGLEATDEILVPGVLRYSDYVKRKATFDAVRWRIACEGWFYEGAELLMFPPEWLDLAHEFARARPPRERRCFLGVDVGEGGDESSWCVGDRYGVVHEEAERTPDTNVIPRRTMEVMKRFGIAGEDVVFDRGLGKPHADRLRGDFGLNVRTVAFGAAVGYPQEEDILDAPWLDERRERDKLEQAFTYKNRRAQMYYEAALLLDPARLRQPLPEGETYADPSLTRYEGRLTQSVPYAIPEHLTELRRQLAPIPKTRDGEGRLWLPPKKKDKENSTLKSLTEIIGCSPDRADAFVLMTHLMLGAYVGTRDQFVFAGGDEPYRPTPERVKGVGHDVYFAGPGETQYLDLPADRVAKAHANGNGKHKPPPDIFIPMG